VSLTAILDRIQAVGDHQAEDIRRKAEQEAQVILAEAQSQAKHDYDNAYQQALEPVTSERAHLLNQARFDALCLVGNARDHMADEVLEAVSQQLQNIRASPDYRASLTKILFEILPGQDGLHSLEDSLVLQADPRDQALLESILQEKAMQIKVEYTLDCWGGLNARSPDGNIQLVNTLESRFQRIMPYLKQQFISWFETEGQPQEKEHVRL